MLIGSEYSLETGPR